MPKNIKEKSFFIVQFILPFTIWLFLFSDILFVKVTVSGDCYSFYSQLKYFFENLHGGNFPLWNPYAFWGGNFLFELNTFGGFNPIWFLILIFSRLGVNFYLAFLYTFIGYFFIGQIGFYCLSKAFLKDRFYAYAAFLLYLFSSAGMLFFDYPYFVLIATPSIWFFYFWVRFWQSRQPRFFIGLTFSVMIILNCYLPFYWLTLFAFFMILYVFLYFKSLKEDIVTVLDFLRQHWGIVLLCILGIFLSALVSLKTYQLVSSGEVVSIERRSPGEDLYGEGAAVSYRKIVSSAPSTLLFTRSIFLNRERTIPPTVTFFYVSFFSWIVLALSVFSKIRKYAVFLLALGMCLFFIIIGGQTVIFQKFFNFFFWFPFIRGFGTFVYLFVPIFILFVTFQLKLMSTEKSPESRSARIFIITAVHSVALILAIKNHFFFSAHITILLSFLFFIYTTLGRGRNIIFQILLLGAIIIAHPIEVMWNLRDNRTHFALAERSDALKAIAHPFQSPRFSFHRREHQEGHYGLMEAYADINTFQESTGFTVSGTGFPSRWSFYLFKNLAPGLLSKYLRNKFYLYDYVKIIDSEYEGLQILAEILEDDKNIALVFRQDLREDEALLEELVIGDLSKAQGQARVLMVDAKDFEVIGFDVNTLKIRTSFDQEKFLVYTDGFASDWQAFVNAEPVPIYISQIAFKGIRIPQGENIVYFRYAPLKGEFFYFLILMIYIGILFYLIILFIRSRGPDREI